MADAPATTAAAPKRRAARSRATPLNTRHENLLRQHATVREDAGAARTRATFWQWIAIGFAALAVFSVALIHSPAVVGESTVPPAPSVRQGLTPAQQKQLADAFKSFDEKFAEITVELGKFVEFDKRLAKFGKALNEVISTSVDTLKSVDDRIAGMNEKLSGLRPQPLDIDKVADQLAGKLVAGQVEKSAAVHSELKNLSGRVETLAARVEALSAQPAPKSGSEAKQEPVSVVTLQPVAPPPASVPATGTDPKSVSPRKLDFSGDEAAWMKLIPRAKFDTIASACSGTHQAWEYYTPVELKRMLAEVERRRLTMADAEQLLKTCDPAILLGSVASLSDEEEAKLNQLLARHVGVQQR